MSRSYTTYDSVTGEVTSTGMTGEPDISIKAGLGEGALLGRVNPEETYIDVTGQDPVAKARVANPTTYDAGTQTFSNIPNPSRVEIRGPINAAEVVTDGEAILSTRVPGEYRVIIRSFPEQEQVFFVEI
jgi:hypothetical protein